MLKDLTSAQMQERLSELLTTRSDVETLYYLMGADLLLEWAHTVGVVTDGPMRDIAPPVPPLSLRQLAAAPAEPVFLWTGLKDAQMCLGYFDRHARLKTSPASVLDFGCGCGRATRYLQASSRLAVHGCDVNERLVSWCQQSLAGVATSLNDVDPPLAYADATFDFIYSLSIFSHLSERSMRNWLGELARVTVEGGIVLLTTHGLPAARTICRSPQHQEMFRMTPAVAEHLVSHLSDVGFRHFPYEAHVLDHAKAGSDYGNAFIHADYIRTQWTGAGFELVEFVEGGLRGWQDVTVLRRVLAGG